MGSIAGYERARLCDLAEVLGPDAPTLCGDWDVRQLVVHLLVRERSPAAVGITVKPLRGLVGLAERRRAGQDFERLVATLRHGPPPWSPFALPRIGPAMNLLEFFVHHEDVRRAQPAWQPRTLPPHVEDALWAAAGHAGKGLVLRAPVGVVAARADTGERTRLRPGSTDVVVRGRPSEVALFLFGRTAVADVELDGADADVARLREADLGF